MFNKLKSWIKNLLQPKEQEEIEEEPVPDMHCSNFEDVYNMFLNGVRDAEQQELKHIRETTPMHIQNCVNCIGCRYHTKEGGIVYCCPKWIPKNY
jgi:hypothetical protein